MRKRRFRSILLSALTLVSASQAMGQAPTVTTNPRFARGATMAFGRIKTVGTNGGPAIQRQGFCLSEQPNPTVDDVLSTKTLSSNGIVFYFDNLKPATLYYMRAYATNVNGETGYGDVIKFSTIPMGKVGYSLWRGGADDATYTRLVNALDGACNYFNNLTSTSRQFDVAYSPGTPTADCNYQPTPHMNIGANTGNQKIGTVMHEMQHGMGLVPYSTQWNKDVLRERLDGDGRGSGHWLGDRVSAFLDFWDNTTGSQLNGDYQHMWPYGINGANEDNGSAALYMANAMLCQALGEDGLEHNETRYADPYYSLVQDDGVKYYLKSESADHGLYTSYLKPDSRGLLQWVPMSAEAAAENDSAAWYITFTPANQYYQLRNAATGQYVSFGSGIIRTLEKEELTINEDWHLMPGRVDVGGQRGYMIIHPATGWAPKCLSASVLGGTSIANYDLQNTSVSKRWLIMTMDEAKANEKAVVAQLKQQVADALTLVKKLTAVPHTETDAGADAQFEQALNSIEQRSESSDDAVELLAMIDEAKAAANDFLQSVVPTDEPFDLTYMIVNPTIDQNVDGWIGGATINYQCGEFFQTKFDFYQTVRNLPAGTYAFCAQGFQRPGSVSAAGSATVNATIYAGSKSEKLLHIVAGGQSQKVGVGGESVISGKNVPNDMQSASAYFKKGLYENRVLTTLGNTGNLRCGIKSTTMNSGYWVIFDNFRLYYYGSKSIDEVTAVKEVRDNRREPAAVYDLQGRRVSQPKRGLYIIGGKKNMVK